MFQVRNLLFVKLKENGPQKQFPLFEVGKCAKTYIHLKNITEIKCSD